MVPLATKQWVQASLLAVVYLISGYYVTAPGMPAAVLVLWGPAGAALAIFLLHGERFWPAVTLPAFALSLWLTGSFAAALCLAGAATLQAWLGAQLLRRMGFEPALNSLRQVLSLFLVAAFSPLVGVAVRELWQLSPLPQTGLQDSWLAWRSDALGILFLCPLLLAWRSLPDRRDLRDARILELAILFVFLLAACLVVFAVPPGQALGFLLVPFGIWGAMRFGLRTVTAINLIVAIAGYAGTLHRLGQFGNGTINERMLAYSGFLLVASLMNLIFYAIFAERTEARDTRSRLAQILENTTDFVGTADVNGRVTFLNAAGRAMVGIGANEDVSQWIVRDFHPKWAAEKIIHEAVPTAMKSGFWRGETALLTRDGRELPVSQVVLAHTRQGEVNFLSTIARDISEEKRGERELRLSEERFSKAFRATPDWITISTLNEGRYLEVNDAFLRASGYQREEVIGHTTLELQVWHEGEDRAQMLETLHREGRLTGVEVRFRHRSGRLVLGSISAEVIEVAGEKCLLAVVRDLTRSRQMEDQLRQAQKMEAVGRLAAGIAHDFNNLLLVIHGYSELQLDSLPLDDPARRGVEEVKQAADRAAALTRQLLAFSRKQVLEPKVLNLNAILGDVSNLLRRLIGANVVLDTILDPALGRVKADPSQVEQILINLAVNARDAMPDGGRITVETADVILDASFAENRPEIVPGKYVMMAVSDTGTGMDIATQAKIFEPFFTTKDRDKGTGLGLATVYGIVKQSSGYIYVYSEPGRGTTFKVFLPSVDESLAVDSRQPVPEDSRGDEHILLVEDEEAVRNLARDFLGLKGYKVMSAASGTDALALMGSYTGELDLLLSDMVMPSVGGRQLAELLRKRWPRLQVLFISGYTDDAVLRAGTLQEGETFLQKPFALTTLAARVREALGTRTRGAAGS